ncbi:MAG: VWA domain-containing protein [Acidobacteriota bacterium]|nr:VWA domain-containing protein [Acidobacteriota bacterium]
MKLVFLLLPFSLFAQEIQFKPDDLDKIVNNANNVFKQAWPIAIKMLESEMQRSFAEMNDGDMIRKIRVTKLSMDSPPTLELMPCPDGDKDCRRMRMRLPGKGNWSIKVAGEIIPPWQRSQTKWRKLRLSLKDLSLEQDFELRFYDGKVSVATAGPPKLTFRLTSPNLIYKAVLAAAQRFMKSSLNEVLNEGFMEELPLAEMALVAGGGFDLKSMIGGLGERLDPEMEPDDAEDVYEEVLSYVSLDGPIPVNPEITPFEQKLEDDAFDVSFRKENIDVFADTFMAEADVRIPPGTQLKHVTFKLGERELARLTKPPYRVRVTPDDSSQVLLATATLSDGIVEDDYLFIEGRGHIEEMEVQYVKVPLSFPTNPFSKEELLALKPDRFEVTEEDVPQTITSLEISMDRPLAFAVVMDMSASMQGERLKRARAAAAKFVDRMARPGDVMRLVSYNNKITAGPRLTHKMDMLKAIAGLRKVKGGTHTFTAVNKALNLLDEEDTGAMRVVLVITDGFNSGGKVTIKKILNRLARSQVQLYTVGISVARGEFRGGGENFSPRFRPKLVHLQDLYDMAVITGGRPFFVDKPAWLDRAFSQIEEELRSQMTLGYTSNLRDRKSGWRRIEVTHLPKKIPIRHRERYWKE